MSPIPRPQSLIVNNMGNESGVYRRMNVVAYFVVNLVVNLCSRQGNHETVCLLGGVLGFKWGLDKRVVVNVSSSLHFMALLCVGHMATYVQEFGSIDKAKPSLLVKSGPRPVPRINGRISLSYESVRGVIRLL